MEVLEKLVTRLFVNEYPVYFIYRQLTPVNDKVISWEVSLIIGDFDDPTLADKSFCVDIKFTVKDGVVDVVKGCVIDAEENEYKVETWRFSRLVRYLAQMAYDHYLGN